MKVLTVAGARPNFIKIAPLMAAYRAHPEIQAVLVHTGQHYDAKMSRLFFDQLRIPRPDVNLEVGSGSHAAQTAEIMRRFEPVVLEQRPDAVVVVGDVNSTVACALVAVKLGVKVVHVEAGLRSFDRTMPEEINRVVTDAISDLLCVSEPSGLGNLRAEGIPEERIAFVGNVMIDTLLAHRQAAEATTILEGLGLGPGRYVAVTLHRPSNVDDAATLERLLGVLETIARRTVVVFPIHPRTRARLADAGLAARAAATANLRLIEPLGYLEFIRLMAHARCVLTDSGGIQEETTILKVPCLTLRRNTERPITVEVGTNRLVGDDPQAILAAYAEIEAGRVPQGRLPEKWDGHAAERIAQLIVERF